MKKIIAIFIIYLSFNFPSFAISENLGNDFYNWAENSIIIKFNDANTANDTNFLYEDKYLKGYIEKALDENYSIKIAKDRILQYENLAKEVNSSRLPFLSLSPQSNTQRNMSTNSGKYTSTGYYNLPLNLNWELDIWGKNSLKYKSAKLNTFSKEQELNMVKLVVVNDLAVSYYNLILNNYLISNTNDRIKNLEETIKYKQSLFKNGIISYDDIYLTKYELSKTVEELNQYKNDKKTFIHQLYVLMGEVPKEELNCSDISDIKIFDNISIQNAELLMFSRPDVMSAKTEFDKAHIDVKVAQKEFLPSFYLNELIGLSSLNISDLFNWYARIYQFGAQAVAELYTGGYKSANLKYNKQVLKEKMHNYYQTILNSIKETKDIISILDNDYQSYLTYKKIVSDAVYYQNILKVRNVNGISNNIDYLDSKRQIYVNSKYLNIYLIKNIVDVANLNKCLGRGIN